MSSSQLNPLWGGVLDQVNLDVVSQVLRLTIRIPNSRNGDVIHSLEFKGLSELRFFNSIPGPWTYAEVTEVYLNVTPEGAAQVEIILWSEEAGLVATADSLTLDGHHVVAGMP